MVGKFAALDTVAYRVHDPKWAFVPTSGAGAGKFGGRANRSGVNALYLSLDVETALIEYQQPDTLLVPALLVSYLAKVDPVVDFRGGFLRPAQPSARVGGKPVHFWSFT